MLEDFTVAAAHDALQPSSNLTLAQIVVWRTRNPFHPKPEQLIVLIGPRIPSQLAEDLINAASSTGRCNTIQCVDSTMLPREK